MDLVHYLVNTIAGGINNVDAWTFLAGSVLAQTRQVNSGKAGECGKTKIECTARPKLICLRNGGDCPEES